MTYSSDFSVDAARHNQLDQRLNGILDFDERSTRIEGQASLDFGSGSAAIELDIEGANLLLNGSKISAPPNTVTLSDGDTSADNLWREDHIYATEAGSFAVAEGVPGDNRYVVHEIDDSGTTPQVIHTIRDNLRAGGPRPKGTDFGQGSGELLWTVLVPPGATTAADLNENHLLDRRRTAIDLLDVDAPRQPAIVSRGLEFPAGSWELWPISTWADQTLRIWSYTITASRFGMFTTDNFKVYLVSYEDLGGNIPPDELDGNINWSNYAIWESGQTKQTSRGDPDQLILDIDTGGYSDAHAFVVENDSDFDYVGNSWRIGVQVRFTLEETADL